MHNDQNQSKSLQKQYRELQKEAGYVHDLQVHYERIAGESQTDATRYATRAIEYQKMADLEALHAKEYKRAFIKLVAEMSAVSHRIKGKAQAKALVK
jgi:hypothetical protein